MTTPSIKKLDMSNVLKISAISLALLASILIVFSMYKPYSVIGYRTLLVDRKSNSYLGGQEFQYGKYRFIIKADVVPREASNLRDCSELIEGGIFGPDADNAPDDQNWWPKEACEKTNSELEAEAAEQKKIKVQYEITNTTSDILKLEDGWLTLVFKDGTTALVANEDINLISNGKASGSIEKDIMDDNNVSGAIVQLPGLAAQTVELKS